MGVVVVIVVSDCSRRRGGGGGGSRDGDDGVGRNCGAIIRNKPSFCCS